MRLTASGFQRAAASDRVDDRTSRSNDELRLLHLDMVAAVRFGNLHRLQLNREKSVGLEDVGKRRIIQSRRLVRGQHRDGHGRRLRTRKYRVDRVAKIIFALKSFFTGVDFRGDTCRLVVIDKLPFPVPSEPVFAARADAIKKYLVDHYSIAAADLVTVGYGKTKLKNDSDPLAAENRRVQIVNMEEKSISER